MTARRPRKTRKSTDDRQAQVTGLRDRLAGFEGELDEEMLAEVLARFDGYSPRNAMLIAMQCPGATDVSGFKAWIDRGRCVRKGEHSIMILAPIAPRGKEGAEDQEQTGSAGPREGEQELVKPRMRFRIAHVFDVSQTDELTHAESVAS
jgi:hypothetical protein